ncbi:MAG: alpha/beta family hydrolase [Acidimicrobiales bacterium]
MPKDSRLPDCCCSAIRSIPGKPDNLRTEHLPDVTVPGLLVQGTRDAFGKPDEFDQHFTSYAGPLEQVWLDGAAHDPKPAYDDQIIAATAAWLAAL